MKKILLGSFFIFSINTFGQNIASAKPLKKAVRSVKTHNVPEKVERTSKINNVSDTPKVNISNNKKTYASLIRMINTVSEDQYKKNKEQTNTKLISKLTNLE